MTVVLLITPLKLSKVSDTPQPKKQASTLTRSRDPEDTIFWHGTPTLESWVFRGDTWIFQNKIVKSCVLMVEYSEFRSDLWNNSILRENSIKLLFLDTGNQLFDCVGTHYYTIIANRNWAIIWSIYIQSTGLFHRLFLAISKRHAIIKTS